VDHGPGLIAHDRRLGYRAVAGADEAGRGCLAGPLVAAAVRIDYHRLDAAGEQLLAGLDDSKRLSPARRQQLYLAILGVAAGISVIVRSAASIDARGLHACNLESLATGLERVDRPGTACLVDGFRLPGCRAAHTALVGGDRASAAIAAASIVAKVTRDRFMQLADSEFPGFGFARHAGYATRAHRDAIRRLGPSPIHRLSFKSAAYRPL